MHLLSIGVGGRAGGDFQHFQRVADPGGAPDFFNGQFGDKPDDEISRRGSS